MMKNEAQNIPQDGVGKILLMFAWPAAWFTILIYIIGKQFIPAGGTTPTWLLLAITILGTGAELAVGLALLRLEGCQLTISSLRDRIRWSWPQGGKAWALAGMVFVLGMSLSMILGQANSSLASVARVYPARMVARGRQPLDPGKQRRRCIS